MKKIFIIALFVYILFLLELVLVNLFGQRFVPDFLLILVMFIVLYSGIRYGLLAAALAGLVSDSFSTHAIGVNIFSYIVCAYLTTILQKYIYRRGSPSSRLLLVFIITTISVFLHFILYVILGVIQPGETFFYVYLPEIILTLLVANWTFQNLKKCVLKLSV